MRKLARRQSATSLKALSLKIIARFLLPTDSDRHRQSRHTKALTCFILFAGLVAMFAGGPGAWARPPQPRMESGIIESVDRTAHVLRLRRADQSDPLTVTWNPRTRLLAKDRLNAESGLQAGKRAIVSYRTPLFGERYATKIELVASTSTSLRR
jgi:hypothetical protein